MALSPSASSNDQSPTAAALKNSYFLYGTHPLKVTTLLTHSNSTTDISSSAEPSNHHLSLNLTNSSQNNYHHHAYASTSDLATTKSLQHFPQTHTDDDDQNNEHFEDALESFDNEGAPTSSNRRKSSTRYETPTVDLAQSLIECQQINQLMFGNHINEAMKKTKAQENRSMYHSLCHSAISFIQAAMTFNPDDIETTIQALRHTNTMAKKSEPYRPWLSLSLTSKPVMGEYELHAKLVYAEALLLRALLTFIQDQGLFSFISGALKIKECHDLFAKLAKHNDPSKFSSMVSHSHFDSGVRMGNGAFNLMIANLPQRIIKYLEFAGFSGDKDYGLNELEKSATSNGLRAPLSALFLLGYHTFAGQIFGNGEGDLVKARMLVDHYLKIYPDSYMFLIFRGRLQTVECHLNEGIRTYEHAIRCQNDWKNLHHIAYWEILWCRVLLREWNAAAAMAEILLNESNWSKATYCYLLATFQFEANNGIATEAIDKLYKRVPELKIRLAGKSIPLEKYAIKQCEHFNSQRWLFLPALELVYIMNGFYILCYDREKMQQTLDIVNKALIDLKDNHQNDEFYSDSYGSGLLLRGVILHFLHRYDEAMRTLDEILLLTKQFEEKSFLPPNALLEKGLIHLNLKQKQKAIECLQRSITDYKDYQLESRLHFRVNAALQTAKRLPNDELKKTILVNRKSNETHL